MKSFGKLLIKLRKKAGLSQNDLAQLIKTNPTHISKIERGNRNPPKLNMLLEMAKALNLNKKQMSEFISCALRSDKSESKHVYPSPFRVKYLDVLAEEESKSKTLERPSVKLISKIFDDPKISEKHKREMEEKIISFISWIKENPEK